MKKLKTIQNQLELAKEELSIINDDKNQLVYDYVEYALILVKQINK